MNNVVGQAVDEFRSDAMKQSTVGGGSQSRLSTMAGSSAVKMDSSEQILEIMQRAETLPKKQPFTP